MPWAAAAAVAGAAITSYSSSRSASKATEASSQAAKDELEFSKAQYEDWLDAFGDIQTNLSDYYENLSSGQFETQALQAFEQEKTLALQEIDANLAQRGIERSGLAKETFEDIAITSAAERARIRAEAPLKTAQAQQEFLQIGLGQNPASNVQGALANQTARLSQDARLATQASAQATGAAVDTTFNALSKILNNNQNTNTGQQGAPVGNPNDSVGNIA